MDVMRPHLVNMPFAALNVPSPALTRLHSRLKERFGGEDAV